MAWEKYFIKYFLRKEDNKQKGTVKQEKNF
jgi:hypothetical protein